MRRWLIAVPLALTAVLTVAVGPSAAKGQVDKIVLSGPGIEGKVSLTDRRLLRELNMGVLEDMGSGRRMRAPRSGDGYELTRYFREPAVRNRPPRYARFGTVRYYPPEKGGRGYVFHESTTGALRANWYDGAWFRATAAGDRAMRRVLARHVVPKESSAGIDGNVVLIAALGLLAGLGFLALRRAGARQARSRAAA